MNLFKFFHNPLLYLMFSQTYLCLSHNDIILRIVWNARGRKTKENNKTVETSKKDKYHSMGDRMRNPKNRIRIANFFSSCKRFSLSMNYGIIRHHLENMIQEFWICLFYWMRPVPKRVNNFSEASDSSSER